MNNNITNIFVKHTRYFRTAIMIYFCTTLLNVILNIILISYGYTENHIKIGITMTLLPIVNMIFYYFLNGISNNIFRLNNLDDMINAIKSMKYIALFDVLLNVIFLILLCILFSIWIGDINKNTSDDIILIIEFVVLSILNLFSIFISLITCTELLCGSYKNENDVQYGDDV